MESTKVIFKNTIKENKKNPQILTIIRDSSFDLARKKLKDLDKEEAKNKIKELFELFALVLKEEKLKDAKSISSVIDALTNAASYDKKEYLFKMIYEREQLEKAIYNQTSDIKHFIIEVYDTIENALTTLKGSEDEKKEIAQGLNDAKLLSVELLGILKDSAEEAFITAIEKGSDIENTVCEISKLLSYHAISEGRFVKQRILDIASTILEAACDIADSDHANASYVLNGAAKGVKEGIIKASEKFKNDMKFAPDEIKEFLKKTEENKLSIIDMEESFIELLKRRQLSSMDISAKILGGIIAEQNTYIAKLKRLSAETAETLSEKIETFKDETLKEIKEKAGKKITKLKKETGEKVTAFTNDMSPKARQFADDAKKLGLHAWELAKNKIDEAVKNTKKKGD
ncbi:MAG: hypothetical protein LBP54_04415 [Campylobacteraceae bacterium]|jgi:hypothetical protein|nr:hypothetical protein [Campylobacteraceae bacterium]